MKFTDRLNKVLAESSIEWQTMQDGVRYIKGMSDAQIVPDRKTGTWTGFFKGRVVVSNVAEYAAEHAVIQAYRKWLNP